MHHVFTDCQLPSRSRARLPPAANVLAAASAMAEEVEDALPPPLALLVARDTADATACSTFQQQ
jgi:hypothetical protein